jgi:hypothetical protein
LEAETLNEKDHGGKTSIYTEYAQTNTCGTQTRKMRKQRCSQWQMQKKPINTNNIKQNPKTQDGKPPITK